jgi:hypothetical protein
MPQVAAASRITMPPIAEERLGERNRKQLRLIRAALRASKRDTVDWRRALGGFCRDPAALRIVLLRYLAHGQSDSNKADVARALLELDCNARTRFLAADVLCQQPKAEYDGSFAMLAVARDRNAPPVLRAHAYNRHLQYLRRAERREDLVHIFDTELSALARENPESQITATLNLWMASVELLRPRF